MGLKREKRSIPRRSFLEDVVRDVESQSKLHLQQNAAHMADVKALVQAIGMPLGLVVSTKVIDHGIETGLT